MYKKLIMSSCITFIPVSLLEGYSSLKILVQVFEYLNIIAISATVPYNCFCRKEKELLKSLETPEEKRARRLAKKVFI